MRFGETPIDEATGAILAHSWRASGVNFSKGRLLSADDVAKLKAAGASMVVAARLDPDDVHEDEAAAAVAKALAGEGIEITAAFTGRCNHFAREAGLAVVDHERIDALNELDESVTVATLPPFARVEPRQMVATVKIIPYAAPRMAVTRAIEVAKSANQPLISVAPFKSMRAGLVQTRLPGTRDKVLDKAVGTTGKRLTSLGSALVGERRVTHDARAIAGALRELKSEGCDIYLIAGASAIVDRHDVVPAGIEEAGGKVTHFGMPVDPGNLLLTAELDGKPVLGLPGCAKSPKYNGFDMVLERLAAGLPVGRAEIVRMGAGGLLAEIPSRPQPRDDDATEDEGPQQAPRVAVLVLAAGRSTRMGGPNKMLADANGQPLVVHAVKAALASQAVEVVVVLGHMADEVRAAIAKVVPAKSRLRFVKNPDFAEGLSTSVRTGIGALSTNVDAAVVQLGDMPGVNAGLLDRLMAAFSPVEGRAICVPTVGGKRGNPVLWARRFFAEMARLAGDTGAKHLIGEHGDLVCEVEMAGEAAVTDIDTPEALAAWRERELAVSFNVAAVRRQFPILSEIIDGQPVHYLDNGASAQTPDAVLDAVRAYETTGRANVLRGVHRLAERATEAYENARIEVATFLGVEPLEVVFTGGCTAAINLVAYSYGSLLKPGDRILLSELEHHSNIVPWQLLRSRTGIELDMIPVTVEGRIDLDALPRLLTPRTKLVSLAHVSNVTGALLDIRAVVTLAKSVGAKVMLDGAQRAPHGPLDLPALGIDFYAFAGHKAYGPNGVGVLWARPELLEAMPPFHGGGSMIGRVTLAETTWAPPPRRFEAGTPPIGQAIGLGTACKWMRGLDWSAAHAHEMALVQRLMDGLQKIDGTQILGPASLQSRYPVVSFMLDGVHPHDVAQTLDSFGVAVRAGHHCCQPLMDRFDIDGTTRVSMAPYNDNTDIDALLTGVQHAARTLR